MTSGTMMRRLRDLGMILTALDLLLEAAGMRRPTDRGTGGLTMMSVLVNLLDRAGPEGRAQIAEIQESIIRTALARPRTAGRVLADDEIEALMTDDEKASPWRDWIAREYKISTAILAPAAAPSQAVADRTTPADEPAPEPPPIKFRDWF